jgi:hypothetical protein
MLSHPKVGAWFRKATARLAGDLGPIEHLVIYLTGRVMRAERELLRVEAACEGEATAIEQRVLALKDEVAGAQQKARAAREAAEAMEQRRFALQEELERLKK